jgi:peptidylprolyl isomerase
MGNPLIKMDLPSGTVLIECLPDKAPNHVNQILKLSNDGLYDGTVFHRVIDNFMAQGGWTRKDPPVLQAEFNDLQHLPGVCSMARTNDPNSASDQFFICIADCRFLDRQYTVWGKVIYGMEHVYGGINRGEPPAEPTPIVRMRQVDVGNI